ncbi:MAG: hypothetical protein K1X79_08195 [Oligoflexia bacterium]|nr:hypothetical protein [Oligoflexia bacterium]
MSFQTAIGLDRQPPTPERRPGIRATISRLGLAFSFLSSFTACAYTPLTKIEKPARLSELAATGTSPLGITIDWQIPSNASLGRQFAFLVLPIGTVESGELTEIVRNSFFEQAALCGYRPLMGYSDSPAFPGAPHLAVKVLDADASAYDLFAMRRLSCSISFKANLQPSPLPPIEGNGEFATYSRYGFQGELSACMDQAVQNGVRQVLHELRLCSGVS